MRDELDKFRAQSNTLDGVEAKIKAVEETLRECQKHATQKEQVSGQIAPVRLLNGQIATSLDL